MAVRLIVSDIDLTLLPSGGKFSDATRSMIAECREKGIYFVLDTGRWFPFARMGGEGCGQSGKDLILTLNGTMLCNMDGETLWKNAMDDDQAEKAYEILFDEDFQYYQVIRDELLCIYDRKNQRLGQEDAYESPCGKTRYVRYVTQQEFRKQLHDVCRLTAYGCTREDMVPRVIRRSEEIGLATCMAGKFGVDILPYGQDKGSGAVRLGRLLGIGPEDIMAFGDAENDVSMLQAVGWPVAVGNAMDEVKAAAKIIAPDCADDGVARVVREYVLNGKA